MDVIITKLMLQRVMRAGETVQKHTSFMQLKFENTAYSSLPIDKSNVNRPR